MPDVFAFVISAAATAAGAAALTAPIVGSISIATILGYFAFTAAPVGLAGPWESRP